MEQKTVKAFGTEAADAPLHALNINRRAPRPTDVEIEILFCGVCHSDLHTARNEWHSTMYPVVPGHEIVGRVTRVGQDVTRFKAGDLAGVGVLVDSCRHCHHCQQGLEQYCEEGSSQAYNTPDLVSGGHTFGGYSESVVVDENYVLHLPENLDLAATAPLLCAGITTYSPLRHWQAGPGKRVGVVGIGGLGHMGVKLAAAMGAHVIAFTTSRSKVEEARALGAHEVVVTREEGAMTPYAGTLDFILDTVSADHNINDYLRMLKVDGTLCLVGAPEEPLPVAPFSVIGGRKSFAGSSIGGIAETQEMLDFCAQHNITSEIEIIQMNQINEAYERLLKGDVKYRFVIDMASLKQAN